MLEELAIECFKTADSKVKQKVKLPNTIDSSPQTIEIVCLVGKKHMRLNGKMQLLTETI